MNPIPETSPDTAEAALRSTVLFGLPCGCLGWARFDIQVVNGKILPATNHHPRCPLVNVSLITVWRHSYDGSSFVSDKEPTAEERADAEVNGTIITEEKMHREIYESLPEHAGF